MKISGFRTWVRELWYENCEEHFQDNIPKYTHEEYFQKFKWWLRREYRHRLAKQKKLDEYRSKFG
jgi:hypothetical protein